MGSQATRRGVPAPAALERLREYLRHDASEADVAVAFAGGVKFELGGLQPSLTTQLSDAEAWLQEAAAKEATVVESIKSRTTSAAPTPRGNTHHAAASLPHLTGEVSPR